MIACSQLSYRGSLVAFLDSALRNNHVLARYRRMKPLSYRQPKWKSDKRSVGHPPICVAKFWKRRDDAQLRGFNFSARAFCSLRRLHKRRASRLKGDVFIFVYRKHEV